MNFNFNTEHGHIHSFNNLFMFTSMGLYSVQNKKFRESCRCGLCCKQIMSNSSLQLLLFEGTLLSGEAGGHNFRIHNNSTVIKVSCALITSGLNWPRTKINLAGNIHASATVCLVLIVC